MYKQTFIKFKKDQFNSSLNYFLIESLNYKIGFYYLDLVYDDLKNSKMIILVNYTVFIEI